MGSESLRQQSTSGTEEKGLLHSPCERRGDLAGMGAWGQAAVGRTWRVTVSLLEIVMG